MKLNPEGYHIPVLQLEDKVIVEPSEIVDYFGKLAEGAGNWWFEYNSEIICRIVFVLL